MAYGVWIFNNTGYLYFEQRRGYEVTSSLR